MGTRYIINYNLIIDAKTYASHFFFKFSNLQLESKDSEERDPIMEKFETIIQDITVYYTKKLDLLRIKSEQHQVKDNLKVRKS